LKIVTIIGARPQFVKAAAVSRAIGEHNTTTRDPRSAIQEIIVHTGQHFDANMSDIFFEEMQIPHPHYHLEINSLSHGAMTGRMLEKIEEVLITEKPDYVMVYGDTNSTMAGALAAKKLHTKVVHVEAGLRSFNMLMPEEINRILTDRISDILCCPTENAVENLINEGFENFPSIIANTGDVMQDAALFYSKFSAEKSTIINALELAGREFALCTIHRAENTDDEGRLRNIFEALLEVSNNIPVVLPLHPRTQKRIDSSLHDLQTTIHNKLNIFPPVGYFDMIELLKHTKILF
jgi:UDP-GlcNAc3NAcA epimerase